MEPKRTEEPAVFKTGTSVSDQKSWLSSLLSQIRELYRAYKHPTTSIKVTAAPDPNAAAMLIEQPSAVRSMLASIRGILEDWRNPRTYAVAPARVDEIWGKRRYKAKVWSFVGYAAVIGLLYVMPHAVDGNSPNEETIISLWLTPPDVVVPPEKTQPTKPAPVENATPSNEDTGAGPQGRLPEVAAPAKRQTDEGGGGGGGGQAATPAPLGKAPEFAQHQLTPPVINTVIDPVIAAPITIRASNAPEFSWMTQTPPNLGDPFGVLNAPPSPGPGTGTGIGTGNGQGVGPGDGDGLGPGSGEGTGGARGTSIPNQVGGPIGGPGGKPGPTARIVKGGVQAPVPIVSPNPAYSEDARKEKIAGLVILEIIVKEDGTVGDISVVRGLGHGLDESAMTTVKTWKFRPGTEDGKPVPVRIRLEVTFRLL
jgi:TonB family protein